MLSSGVSVQTSHLHIMSIHNRLCNEILKLVSFPDPQYGLAEGLGTRLIEIIISRSFEHRHTHILTT